MDLDPIWAWLLGGSQLSNPSDLPCFVYFQHDILSKLSMWRNMDIYIVYAATYSYSYCPRCWNCTIHFCWKQTNIALDNQVSLFIYNPFYSVIYDAFISYTDDDLWFVNRMQGQLEGPPHNLHLCIDERDILPGGSKNTITGLIIEKRWII